MQADQQTEISNQDPIGNARKELIDAINQAQSTIGGKFTALIRQSNNHIKEKNYVTDKKFIGKLNSNDFTLELITSKLIEYKNANSKNRIEKLINFIQALLENVILPILQDEYLKTETTLALFKEKQDKKWEAKTWLNEIIAQRNSIVNKLAKPEELWSYLDHKVVRKMVCWSSVEEEHSISLDPEMVKKHYKFYLRLLYCLCSYERDDTPEELYSSKFYTIFLNIPFENLSEDNISIVYSIIVSDLFKKLLNIGEYNFPPNELPYLDNVIHGELDESLKKYNKEECLNDKLDEREEKIWKAAKKYYHEGMYDFYLNRNFKNGYGRKEVYVSKILMIPYPNNLEMIDYLVEKHKVYIPTDKLLSIINNLQHYNFPTEVKKRYAKKLFNYGISWVDVNVEHDLLDNVIHAGFELLEEEDFYRFIIETRLPHNYSIKMKADIHEINDNFLSKKIEQNGNYKSLFLKWVIGNPAKQSDEKEYLLRLALGELGFSVNKLKPLIINILSDPNISEEVIQEALDLLFKEDEGKDRKVLKEIIEHESSGFKRTKPILNNQHIKEKIVNYLKEIVILLNSFDGCIEGYIYKIYSLFFKGNEKILTESLIWFDQPGAYKLVDIFSCWVNWPAQHIQKFADQAKEADIVSLLKEFKKTRYEKRDFIIKVVKIFKYII